MADHDGSYKLLFSHARMVADLLVGFVHEEWVKQLDFGSLEKVSGSYVSDDLRDREDDVIWRVRWGEEWVYVYLLIEFQSKVEAYMAVRMLTYVGLLYQDLIKAKQLPENGKLPPVLPIVLYNGAKPWDAAEELADLIGTLPPGLEAYRPRLRYLLLDEGQFSEAELKPLKNLVAALFRLENAETTQAVRGILGVITKWFNEEDLAGIQRAFVVWLTRVLLPARFPGVEIPEVSTLQEMNTMLAERVIEWTKEWKKEGLEEGLQQGLQQGEAAILTRLLTRRFGPLPGWVQARLKPAPTGQLECWAERVLDASRLEDVFE